MKINAEKSNVKQWLSTASEGKRGTSHAKLWARLYDSMAVPRRKRTQVNLNKIGKLSREGEHVMVPGKVLGIGTIDHRISITALEYSAKAREELEGKGCKIVSIGDAYNALKGSKTIIRIIK